jgi:hypothetical protein
VYVYQQWARGMVCVLWLWASKQAVGKGDMQLDKGLASVSRVGELLLLCVTLDRSWVKAPTQAAKFVCLACCWRSALVSAMSAG